LGDENLSLEDSKDRVAIRVNKLLMLSGDQNTNDFWVSFLLEHIPIQLSEELDNMTHEKAEKIIQEFSAASFPDLNQLDAGLNHEALKAQYLSKFETIVAKVRQLSHAEAIYQFQQIRQGLSKDTLEQKSMLAAVSHTLQQKLNDFIAKFNIEITKSETQGLKDQIKATEDKVKKEVYDQLAEILKAVLNGLVHIEAELYEFLSNVENQPDSITGDSIQKALFLLNLFESLALKTDKDALFEFRHHLLGMSPVFRLSANLEDQVHPKLIKLYRPFVAKFVTASAAVVPLKDIFEFLKAVVGKNLNIVKLEKTEEVLSKYFLKYMDGFILKESPKISDIENIGDPVKKSILGSVLLLSTSEYNPKFDELLKTQIIPNVEKLVIDDISRDLIFETSDTIGTTYQEAVSEIELLKLEFILRFVSQFTTQNRDSIFIDIFEFTKRFMSLRPDKIKEDPSAKKPFLEMKTFYTFLTISLLTSARGDPDFVNLDYEFKLFEPISQNAKDLPEPDKKVIEIYNKILKLPEEFKTIFSTPIETVRKLLKGRETEILPAIKHLFNNKNKITIMTKPTTVKETTTVESRKEARERQQKALINVKVNQEDNDLQIDLNSIKLIRSESGSKKFNQDDESLIEEDLTSNPVTEPIKKEEIIQTPPVQHEDEHVEEVHQEIHEDENPKIVITEEPTKIEPVIEENPKITQDTLEIQNPQPIIEETPNIDQNTLNVHNQQPVIEEKEKPQFNPLLFPEGVIPNPQHKNVHHDELLDDEEVEEELLDQVEENQPTVREIIGTKQTTLHEELEGAEIDYPFKYQPKEEIHDDDEENNVIGTITPPGETHHQEEDHNDDELISDEPIDNQNPPHIHEIISTVDETLRDGSDSPKNKIKNDIENSPIKEETVEQSEPIHFDTPQEKKNFIHYIKDKLPEESIRAIEDAPDLVQFVRNKKVVVDPVTGEETHYHYILIIPYMSNCYKALKLKKEQAL